MYTLKKLLTENSQLKAFFVTLQSKSKERQLREFICSSFISPFLLHLPSSLPFVLTSLYLEILLCPKAVFLFPSQLMVHFSSPHLLALILLEFLYEFMCSTWMAEVETVRQRSLWAVRSATLTGLYWISPADTVLY